MKWNFVFGEERAIAHQAKGQRLSNFLEETLYILWELSPSFKGWEKDLLNANLFLVRYCDVISIVSVDKMNRVVTVIDL